MIVALINVIFGTLFIGGAGYFWLKNQPVKKTDEIKAGAAEDETVLVSISVPKNNDRKPFAAEQMFAALHGIFRSSAATQPHLSFELASKDRQIMFYAHMPAILKDFVLSQIYAQYPNVEINIVPKESDYAHLDEGKAVAVTELALKKDTVYPIKTFQNFEVDPLSAITGVLSSAQAGEEIWVQMVIRPIDDTWQEKGEKTIKEIKEPPKKVQSAADYIKNEAKTFAKDLIKGVVIPPSPAAPEKKKDDEKKEVSGPQGQVIKAIEEKITKLGFESTIRIVVAAPDPVFAKARLEQVVGAFKQFNSPYLNSISSKDIVEDKEAVVLYQQRVLARPEIIFNTNELASLYHFPSETVETPTINWAGAKKGEPPPNLPVISSIPADELTIFAQTNFRNEVRKFGIKKKDRRLHMYIIGKTGTGKSTLMENMIFDDIREGRGVAVVDPHGELIDHVLDFIPESRINDVVYFNPADSSHPVGFNVLENVNPEMRGIIASGVVGIFKKIFGESWGPRLEYILRNSILALLEYPNSTLLGVMRILTDNSFRRLVINQLTDPVIKDFFVNEYEKYEPKFRQEAIAPIQNKVGQFLSSSVIRNIIGQPQSTMRISDIMNQGKILLADLSTGKIGEDNSALLGAMLITKIQLSAMERTNIAEEDRRDFYLYVDEFQNFATDSFATILSEARKYRLNLVMINQYISQMPESVANAVFGNVGTMIAFRVGAGDAQAMQSEYQPVFDVNDLVNQPNRHIYLKMAIDGVTMPAFSASTLPPPAEKSELKSEVVSLSRQQFTRPRADIEEYIADWSSPIDLSLESGRSSPAPSKIVTTAPQIEEQGIAPKSEIGEISPIDQQGEQQPSLVPLAPHLAEPVQDGEGIKGGLPENKKIEILKDRFNRRWYAVSDKAVDKKTGTDTPSPVPEPEEGRAVADVEVAAVPDSSTHQPVEAITAEPLVTQEQINAGIPGQGRLTEDSQTDGQSREVGEQGEEKQHLITWEKADELGLKLEKTSVSAKSEPKDDWLPIDEL